MLSLFVRLFDKCRRLSALVICVFCASAYADGGAKQDVSPKFRFKPLSVPKLEMVGGLWDTAQDSHGFLWFAGAGGVARYDGYELKVYRNDPKDPSSVSGNYVNDLMVDKDGNLWVATRWGLNRYDFSTDTFERFVHDPKNPKSLSHNFVWRILQVRDGSIWAATGSGLNRFDFENRTFEWVEHQPENRSRPELNNLWTLYEDSQGLLWLGAEKDGLYRYDRVKGEFTHFKHVADDPSSLSNDNIFAINEDGQNNLWVGTNIGLNLYDRATGTFTRFLHDPNDSFSLGGNAVRSIHEDRAGRLWFAIDGAGINLYEHDSNRFYHFIHNQSNTTGLLNNKVRTIFEDASGGLWFGHFPAGVSMLDPYASAFNNYKNDPLEANSLSNSDILSVTEDRHGNLWVGTEQGLNYINRSNESITRYEYSAKNPEGLQANPVLTILEDHDGDIWVGTWGGGMSRFDADSGTFIRYPELNAKEARKIYQDSAGAIWIGTENGISHLNKNTGEFVHYTHDSSDPKSLLRLGVNGIFEDSKNQLWLACDTGVALMDRKDGTFTRFEHNPNNPGSLGSGYFTDIVEDSAQRLWFISGATGVNLLDRDSFSFKLYRAEHGLADDVIGGLLEDEAGTLWFSTGSGISHFDPETERFLKTYTVEHGLPGNLFKRPAAVNSSRGELVFGSSKGLTIFKPEDLVDNQFVPPVVISDFQIFYKPVPLGAEGSPLAKKITETQSITLNYKQSVFSFEFVSLNFQMPEKNQYAYKLEGFDSDWIQGGDRRTAGYTNLDAGHYVFRVKASNNEGVWNEAGDALDIRILPPPWRTWWAYTLYVLAILAAIAQFVRSQRKKRHLVEEQNRLLEIKVAERTVELQKKNHDIQAMLGNMRQGLFTIEEGCLIHPEYSRHLESIFETSSIAGENAFELMFRECDIKTDALDQIKEGMGAIINESSINFDFNAHLLVKEYNAVVAGHTKCLSLDWNPIIVDDVVIKLMVSVRDVTVLRQMENEARSQKRELEIIEQLIKVPASKFMSLEASCQKLLEENRNALEHAPEYSSALVEKLFRNMHTVKGNSRTYGFAHLSNVVHDVESRYSELSQSQGAGWHAEELLLDLQKVEQGLQEYAHVFYKVLGRDGGVDEGPLVDDGVIDTIKNSLDAVNIASEKEKLKPIYSLLNDWESCSLDEVLADLNASLPSIAQQLGKVAPEVCIESAGMRVHKKAGELVTNVFSHILRNALDHGIESPEQRQASGKDARGHISIKAQSHEQQVNIRVKDDGRGVNLERLYKKGLEMGVWSEGVEPKPQDVANIIFMSGVSTKERVSDISGRGVGMDAVKQFLQERGGDIQLVLLDENRKDSPYVQFESLITLPSELFVKVC